MLNPQQMAAVTYITGPLLVLAGAGSGKTRVITQKIAHLLLECDYVAHQICAVTFTNKAANEMKHRIASILPAPTRRGLRIGTFHTLGLNIIKQHLTACGLNARFSIFDAEDSLQLLRGQLPTNLANDKDELKRLQQQISHWKNEMQLPEQVMLNPLSQANTEDITIYTKYQQALQACNAVDFDDLIRLPVYLFKNNPEILLRWQNKIRHFLIDEYQDSNHCQYELVKLLVGTRAQFTVVGDDDQSVYAWRGARPENLAQLSHDFPNIKLIKLEQNYRSTTRILQAANQLISHNTHLFEKKLWSELGSGELLRVLCCRNEQDEADQVIGDMIRHRLCNGAKYGHYAILYRGNHQSRIFEKVLRHHGIPYQLSGGQSWFARTEVKDMFAYLKLICNPADDAAFLRVINLPKRGIGNTTLTTLGQYAAARGQSLYLCSDHLALLDRLSEASRLALQNFKQWFETIKTRCQTIPIMQALRELIDESGYEAWIYEQSESSIKAQKRMDNVWELFSWIERLLSKDAGSDLAEIMQKLILIDILEQSDQHDEDTVQLMTLHAVKGLEFPHVYLVGMEEELLPHRVSIDNDQIEEERRLAYVGVTRAQKTLCLTLARARRRAGELQECLPSRFLEELPQDSLEWYGKGGERDEVKSKALAQSHLAGLKNLLTLTT